MPFKFNPAPDLAVTVKLSEPLDNGKSRQHDMSVRYRIRSVEDYRNDLKDSRDGKLSDLDILERDVVDIEGVRDTNGEPIPFSLDLLRELASWSWVLTPLILGWNEVQSQTGELYAKN